MNNEIIISPKFEALTRKYEILQQELTNLALEREELCATLIPNLKAEFQVKIGVKEYELFIRKCELQRAKRKVELIQVMLNRMEPVAIAVVEAQLDAEFAEWKEKIERMADEIRAAECYHALPKLSVQEHKQFQKLFRQIAKSLHPDLNQGLTEEQKRLWLRASEAYQRGDLNALLAVSIILEDFPEAPTPSSLHELAERCDGLKQQINALLAAIKELKNMFPMNHLNDLSNPEWIAVRQGELKKGIEDINKEIAGLLQFIAIMSGGIQIAQSTATH